MAGAKESDGDAAQFVRQLARDGELASRAAAVSGDAHRWLRAGAHDIAWRVVFQRKTRGLEAARGHHACASSIRRLEPDCYDRFADDVEAVIDDLLRHASTKIEKLEGWIASRINAATVDAHRRRRGERGALQRPRLPGWLATRLGHDRWLTVLAIEVLNWVGIPATAGAGIWPLGAWTERRAAVLGGRLPAEQDVARDVETVLRAMRTRPMWYADFVERPLGHKQAPVLPAPRTDPDPIREPGPLPLVGRHESDDAHLTGLATVAVDAIADRIGRGESPRAVVADVIATTFGAGSGVEDMDRVPGTGPAGGDVVARMVADPAARERVVSAVLAALAVKAH